MRILYLSQYFPPEVGATQTRAHEMARHLVRMGHHVTVLAEFPNHPRGIIPEHYRGRFWEKDRLDGIEVIRTWVYARSQKTFRTRILFYLSFMVSALLAGLFLRGRYDVVYATSPPFFVGLTGLLLSRFKNAEFIFEVRDLWPRSAVELGELRNRFFIKLSEKLETLYYRHAARIVVVTAGIRRILTGRGIPEGKLVLITNGTTTELFRYTGDAKKREWGLGGKFVVLYAGIFGLAQGLERLCELAELLKPEEGIHFVFVGEGPLKPRVERLQQERNLHNLTLLDEVPREVIPEYISASDACLVPLQKNPLFLGALPSKMFDYLACERPVILSVDGEARKVLEECGGGLYAEPENIYAMAQAILKLKAAPAIALKMGKSGRAFVEKYYSRRGKAEELERLLREVVEG